MMENLVDHENLIVDIVSRLPVQSVLRCRCVCKSWRALLHETYFTQIHADRSLQQQQHQLLDDYDNDDDYDSSSSSTPVSFLNLVYSEATDSHEFHLQDYYYYVNNYMVSRPLNPPPSLRKEDEAERLIREIELSEIYLRGPFSKSISWEIVGSCNGLICLYGLKTYHDNNYYNTAPLIIYNPLTRECLKLPPVDQSQCAAINNAHQVACGLGYHPSTKEYKIVRIIHQLQVKKDGQGTASSTYSYVRWVQIYTLGGGSSRSGGKWRTKKELEQPKDCLFITVPGVPFNGALYWVRVGVPIMTIKKRMIISFDLADEKFQIIPSPPLSTFHDQSLRLDTELGVLGQNLCMFLRTHSSTDIWMMNNNTAKCSWSKKFRIRTALAKGLVGCKKLKLPISFVLSVLYQPIGLTKQGRVLCILDEKYLVSFDPITKNLKSLGCMSLFKSENNKISYTKSFVSLKALGEEGATIL